MKKLILLAIGSVSCAALLGCGDDTVVPSSADASTDHTTTFEAATPTDTGNGVDVEAGPTEAGGEAGKEAGPTVPPAPVLGAQIDRMGRPAINTALNHTFDPACTTASCPAKDAYNADNVITHWPSYVPQFEANLAVYDGLDGTCGNQAGFGASGYATLATVLADDRLWVDTANTTCQQYLGVEFAALGVSNSDCGGRAPNENVIDLTFNAVAGTLNLAGLPSNPGPVTNGITAPASPASTTFPYLQPPH